MSEIEELKQGKHDWKVLGGQNLLVLVLKGD